ncbi:MAG: hypothetical protein K2N64_00430 [Anaeroplasmataceae bacterium]|nr:hypothetical protein [Anaeroplasmataceae bacterium]
MKKRGRIALIYIGAIIFVFGGLALTIITQNILFIYAIFGLFFLLGLLSIFFHFKRFYHEYERQVDMDMDKVLEDINENSNNRLEYEVQQVKAVVDTWKLSNKGDKIKGILFVTFFIGCLLAFAICMFLGHMVYGFIFFGLGVGEILISFIVVKLLETRSLHFKKRRCYRKATAIVLGTTMSSQSTMGTKRQVRIGNTTYKVFLRINDTKVTTYSKEYYDVGDKVSVNIDEKNPKIVHIIGKQIDIFEMDEEL